MATATSALTDNSMNDSTIDWQVGYGYQFWRCQHGAFRGDGAYGQYCIVLPEQDAVVVITSAHQEMQRALDAVWAELLPAFADGEIADAPRISPGCELGSLMRGSPSCPAATGNRTGPWTFAHQPNDEHPVLRSVSVRRR